MDVVQTYKLADSRLDCLPDRNLRIQWTKEENTENWAQSRWRNHIHHHKGGDRNSATHIPDQEQLSEPTSAVLVGWLCDADAMEAVRDAVDLLRASGPAITHADRLFHLGY